MDEKKQPAAAELLVNEHPVDRKSVTLQKAPAILNEAQHDLGNPAGRTVVYLSGAKLAVVMLALLLSSLLVNLDQTIVATALPRIVSQFNALEQASWIATAYFLTDAGLMLSVTQLLDTLPVKYVFMTAIFAFEAGSTLCGAAPSMEVLILGRAVAGCGSAGIVICSIATIAEFTPLEKRPSLFACFGATLAIASILGPIIGGAFTDHISWRWCFYINLPFGFISAIVLFFWYPVNLPHSVEDRKIDKYNWYKRPLDWLGTLLCLGFATCLLLALVWGGTTKKWSDPVIIALLCLFAILLGVFMSWQRYLGDASLLPFYIFSRRTQVCACLESLWLLMALIVTIYYLPLWYQVNGRSATQSGIDILPLMLSFIIAAGVGSCFNQVTGRYWHLLFFCPMLAAVGSGLLFTMTANTSPARLLGYQILVGAGIGGSFQTTYVAIQVDWADEPEKTTRASGTLTFVSFFGGILGIGIAGTVYNNNLSVELARIPGISSDLIAVLEKSILAIGSAPENLRSDIISAFIKSLRFIFLIPLISSVLAIVSSAGIKNHDMKKRNETLQGMASSQS